MFWCQLPMAKSTASVLAGAGDRTGRALFRLLPEGRVIVIDGIVDSAWEAWRTFLMDFEVASRSHPASMRPVLLVIVRGVPLKRLQAPGAALELLVWQGVFGELDILIHVDNRLKLQRQRTPQHRLVVRQIAGLALWDLGLADYLAEQPAHDLFDAVPALRRAMAALAQPQLPVGPTWELGGLEIFDGVQTTHPCLLIERGDPGNELTRRLWSIQAACLLPLIELRRRELADLLQRHVPCPIRLPDDQLVRSLNELEIGPLAHVARRFQADRDLCDRAQWLAECRNALAHLGLLTGVHAMDRRLHG